MAIPELIKTDRSLFIETMALSIFTAALPFSVSLIQGALLLFLGAALFRRYTSASLGEVWPELKANPLFVPWLAYLAAGLVAALTGADAVRSLKALNSDLFTAMAFFSLCLFVRPKARDTALDVYVISVTIAATYGITQALHGLWQGTDIRAHATNHPVRFGEIMVIGLALILSRLFSGEELVARTKRLLHVSAALLISAIALSQTRGAYLGAALVFAVLFMIKPSSRKAIIATAAAAALLGILLSAANPRLRYKAASIFLGANSAFTRTAAPDQSIGTRLILWRTGAQIIRDHPLFGIGPGNVKKLFPQYCPPPYPEDKVWGSLHNLYIHQTAERGLFGLAALLTLFISMLRAAAHSNHIAPSAITSWALAIMLPYYLMNFTEITFQHVHTSYAVLLALAVSVTARRIVPRQ